MSDPFGFDLDFEDVPSVGDIYGNLPEMAIAETMGPDGKPDHFLVMLYNERRDEALADTHLDEERDEDFWGCEED